MNLKSLRAFLFIMDHGSLAAAASNMNLSQPAVSRLVQLLEQETKVILFYRNQKTLAPTPEAEAFYPEAQRVIAAVDGFPDFFARIHEGADEPFHVVCQMRTASGLVVPALTELVRRNRDLRLTLDIHPRRELGRRLQHDRFDVAVYMLPLQLKRAKLLDTRKSQLCVLLPREHHLAERTVLSPKELAGERYVAHCRGLILRESVDRSLARIGQRLEPFHEVNSADAAYKLVSNGIGFCFCDPVSLNYDTLQRTVVVAWEPKVELELGIFAPTDRNHHEAISDFVECLDEVWRKRTLQE